MHDAQHACYPLLHKCEEYFVEHPQLLVLLELYISEAYHNNSMDNTSYDSHHHKSNISKVSYNRLWPTRYSENHVLYYLHWTFFVMLHSPCHLHPKDNNMCCGILCNRIKKYGNIQNKIEIGFSYFQCFQD